MMVVVGGSLNFESARGWMPKFIDGPDVVRHLLLIFSLHKSAHRGNSHDVVASHSPPIFIFMFARSSRVTYLHSSLPSNIDEHVC